MTFQPGKYSTVFWSCYFLYAAWSLLSIVTFPLQSLQVDQLHGFPKFQLTLSNTVFGRDLVFAAISVSFSTILIGLRSHFLREWLLFVAAWMWAVYLDDLLALDHILIAPDGFGSNAISIARPLVVLAVSRMAFEAVTRRPSGNCSG